MTRTPFTAGGSPTRSRSRRKPRNSPAGFEAKPYEWKETTRLETYGDPQRDGKSLHPQVISCASAHCSDPDTTPPGRHVLPFTFSYDSVGGPEVEFLDRTLILGEPHLRAILTEYQAHYNTARPHQGIGQRIPNTEHHAPRVTAATFDARRIYRKPVLSGLINEYVRAA